jgi:hypothetical protein
LRQVLPQLVQNLQMANEQLMRLGHKELEHALEELVGHAAIELNKRTICGILEWGGVYHGSSTEGTVAQPEWARDG